MLFSSRENSWRFMSLTSVSSLRQFLYYVVLIDDFSQYYWLYHLKRKFDFFDTFITFQRFVENQFKRKIKSFQFDGGGEFMNNDLLEHFPKCGIQHLISCRGHLSKMASPKGSIILSSNWAWPCCLKLPCHCAIGLKHSNC